jgi:tRNA(Arg) A34 adenosine deaminase TadA
MTLNELLRNSYFTGKKVAAQFEARSNHLYYHAVDAQHPIPPSVYLLESARAGGIMLERESALVNYPAGWMNTYGTFEAPYSVAGNRRFTSYDSITVNMNRWNAFSLDGLGTKPGLSSIYEEVVPRGVSRARRLYLLAAFALLKSKAGLVSRGDDRHNIGGILVSDDGEVLAWGVNTGGGYRHAEVNTLISYFKRNPTQTKLPRNSVLFTTLKPCHMCSTYIRDSWNAGATKVWYGMDDTGSSGSTPLLGEKADELPGESDVQGPADWSTVRSDLAVGDIGMGDLGIGGTKPVMVEPRGGKVDLTGELDKSLDRRPVDRGKPLMVAKWVDRDRSVTTLFAEAEAKLLRKINKPEHSQIEVTKVLSHIKDWITRPVTV